MTGPDKGRDAPPVLAVPGDERHPHERFFAAMGIPALLIVSTPPDMNVFRKEWEAAAGSPGWQAPVITAAPDEAALLRQALAKLAAPIPGTKGMAPKERAQRLHAEMERRIQIARDALHLAPKEAP